MVEKYLSCIHDRQLNTFVSINDNVLEQATAVQKKIDNGRAGRLAGLVLGVKDVLSVKEDEVRAGSKILEGYHAPYTATAIQRLLDEDALIIGRNNCDEFGMGSSNENSALGAVKNPIDEKYVPGGSSGGSAAAVAANQCMISIGSDTGGSVRQPAAFCNVIGLKPTYGRISRYGLLAYASSFDTIGIVGNTVPDIRNVFGTMAGHDENDSTSSSHELTRTNAVPKRIFVLEDAVHHPSIDDEVADATLKMIDQLRDAGCTITMGSFAKLDHVLPAYYVLTAAEASSNLSRYDGVKFGRRASNQGLQDMYESSRTEGFGSEVIRRIMLGTFVLSASYYDAYFTKAQKVRRLIKNEVDQLFKSHDLILLPTTPTPPFKLGEMNDDPINMYLADLFTVIASVTGHPAISLPNGLSSKGLPIGLQLIGKDFGEEEILNFADFALSLKHSGGN